MIEINKKELENLIDIYKHLHQNPELSFQEKETSEFLLNQISNLGFEIIKGFGIYGFVGILKNGEGPTIMLRTDIDALPIKELTGLDYCSTKETVDWFGNNVNVMHACGHDLHMTLWLGTILKLVEYKESWSGTLIVLAQPAEEIGKGAKAMIEDGLFKKIPIPNFLLAYHDLPDLEEGKVGYTKGISWAGCDTIDLIVYGEGGHGANPHKAKDPIVLSAQIILALQTIVSREVSAFEKVVLTIGSIKGGTKHNIIPEEVELKISLRTFSTEIRDQVVHSIKRIAENTARAFGIKEEKMPIIKGLENYHPPVFNEHNLVDSFVKSASIILGEKNVVEIAPVTVSEDFEIFRLAEPSIQAAILWVGVENIKTVNLPDELKGKTPPLHSPYLAPSPEKPIITGVKAMTKTIIDLFAETK